MNYEKDSFIKVAQITFLFWAIKILATTFGERLGDLLPKTLNFGYLASLMAMFIVFIIALSLQLRAKRLYVGLYWFVIIGTTTVGKEISDFMERDTTR